MWEALQSFLCDPIAGQCCFHTTPVERDVRARADPAWTRWVVQTVPLQSSCREMLHSVSGAVFGLGEQRSCQAEESFISFKEFS